MQSLLSNVKSYEVFSDPFPHLVVQNPIDPALCSQLIAEFPAIEVVAQGEPIKSNQRFSYSACHALADPEISSAWKEFIRIHTSQVFLEQFVSLFEKQILQVYPNFIEQFGALDQLKAGVRSQDSFSNSDVLLDAQICVNTPVTTAPSSVKRGHVDIPNKLFAGLFYLRHPADDSVGGDLELYKFKRNKAYGFRGQFIDDRYLEFVKSVKYQSNVLVLFLNSVHALHGVSVRSQTDSPRLFLNLVGEVKAPLFDLKQYKETESWIHKLYRSTASSLK